MKTLKHIFMGIMLIIIIPICNSQTATTKEQVITLQSRDSHHSKKNLADSKKILIRRLEYMNFRNIQVTPNFKKSQLVITITTPDTINRETLPDILLVQGKINFYETMNSQEVLKYLEKKSSGCLQHVFTLLHTREGSMPFLGAADAHDTAMITACLNSEEVRSLLPKGLQLIWTCIPNENKEYVLYAVLSADTTFNEKSITEAHPDFKNPAYPTLCITFRENMWESWKNKTIKNIDRYIAFVVDNKVYFAPRVRAEIPTGKISMTGGGFSKVEIRKLVAIISNGVLPVQFKVADNP